MRNVSALDPGNPTAFKNLIRETVEILNQGGVIAFPTDTFYGLGVNPALPEAIEKVFKLKQRPADKPLLVLIHDKSQLAELTESISTEAERFMSSFWPGPLTLLFPVHPALPKCLTADTGKIGVRLPAQTLTCELIRQTGHPLTAPSANPSDAPEPRTAREVADYFGDDIDLILDGGTLEATQASTIVDPSPHPRLIREGAVSQQTIETTLALKFPAV